MKHFPRIQINGQPYSLCQETAWQRFCRKHIACEAPSDLDQVMSKVEPASWIWLAGVCFSIGLGLGSFWLLILRLCGVL
jgi:hypothetical protein